jgi:diaminohydroxyphosphoribosylaminopyrimidine deaminase / 5-amino-6-(5-phosphoribosylamino)uracil reductase
MDEKKIKIHQKYLKLALEEAQKGRGYCFPNPSVGAIAVKNEEIVGRAYHLGAGHAHAEALLLKELPQGLEGITLYVTLEPCNHYGRTPPCVDAIIEYGVQKVIFGCYDANKHIVSNDSTQMLQSNGIEVEYCELSEIIEFYRSYHHWVRTRKPFITAKWAQSFDAKVSFVNQPVKLTNAMADAFTHQQRLHSDMILTTANTILCDNPRLNVRLDNIEIAKPLAILDAQLKLSGQERCFASAKEIHIFHHQDVKPTFKHEGIHYHPVDGSPLKLEQVIHILGDIGVHDVWVEAGPQLMASLHDEKIVNRTHIFMVPRILGKQGLDAYEMKTSIFARAYQLQFQQMDDNMLATFLWQEF